MVIKESAIMTSLLERLDSFRLPGKNVDLYESFHIRGPYHAQSETKYQSGYQSYFKNSNLCCMLDFEFMRDHYGAHIRNQRLILDALKQVGTRGHIKYRLLMSDLRSQKP
jgi:hypothetical protein